MKEKHKSIVRNLIRLSPFYRKLSNDFGKGNYSQPESNPLLKKILKHAVKNTPYYRNTMAGAVKQQGISLDLFPYIKKTDVIGKEKEFISDKALSFMLMKKSTGGTSGLSLNLQKDFTSIIAETFFTDQIFSLISPVKTQKIAILRAIKPENGLFEYNHPLLILSSYDINAETTKKYLSLLKEYKIDCLHAFPSSLAVWCKYINDLKEPLKLPDLKGIVTSSETITKEDKKLIMRTFPNAKLIDIYGQNEHVALAYAVDHGPYHFVNQYSVVEFLDSGNTFEGNKVFEIIGTNFYNKSMPLIRYQTEDYAEIDSKGKVLSILGRSQDIIINNKEELVPCILSMRPNTLQNVINYQYYQEKPGELYFRAVGNHKFNIEDQKAIEKDIFSSFGGKVKPIISKVEAIERLPNGKQKRLVQKLNLNLYR